MKLETPARLQSLFASISGSLYILSEFAERALVRSLLLLWIVASLAKCDRRMRSRLLPKNQVQERAKERDQPDDT
jgi:hypothetical protein